MNHVRCRDVRNQTFWIMGDFYRCSSRSSPRGLHTFSVYSSAHTQHNNTTPQWIKHLSQDITISFLCRRKTNVWSFTARRCFNRTMSLCNNEEVCGTRRRANDCLLKIWWPVHFGEDTAIALSLFPSNLCRLFSLAVFSGLWFIHIEALRASVWCQLTKKTEMKNINVSSNLPSTQTSSFVFYNKQLQQVNSIEQQDKKIYFQISIYGLLCVKIGIVLYFCSYVMVAITTTDEKITERKKK